jgi:PAS domain S-box-containing protein
MRELQRQHANMRPSTYSAALEQMLRASDVLLDILPMATCICDPDGTIVQYNRRAVEVWGRRPQPGETHEHFTSVSKFFRSDGQLLPRNEIPMTEVLKTGRPVHEEEMIVERPDGSRVVILITIDPLLDAQGALMGAISCFQDITEREHVRAALERSQSDLLEHEQRLAATYEHAAIGIVETDAEGKFLRVNEAICAITGRERDELMRITLWQHTLLDDVDSDREAYRKQVNGDLNIYSIEKRITRGDGRQIWIAVRSTPVRDSYGRFLYGVRVVQDITERKAAEERQKLLIDELNHRVKNTLATVQSLATQSSRGAPTAQTFRQSFEGRLIALSKAHDQLTLRHWESADLREIVRAGIAPYLTGGPDQGVLRGEDVTLRPRAALTLAMVFHELTTNAAKYGALSVPSGRINVQWEVQPPSGPDAQLRIAWQEQGGPPVSAPTRRGFGSKFIVGSIASELGGRAALDFASQGLRCTIDIPLAATEDAVSRASVGRAALRAPAA